jgi:hypothetical protein
MSDTDTDNDDAPVQIDPFAGIATPAQIDGALSTDETRVHHLTGQFRGMTLVNKINDPTLLPSLGQRRILVEGGVTPVTPAPTLWAIVPPSVPAGSGVMAMALFGSRYVPGVTNVTSAAGGRIVDFVVVSDERINANIDFTASTPGTVNLVVTNGPGLNGNRNVNIT